MVIALNGAVIKARPNYRLFSVYTASNAYSLTPITSSAGTTSFEWKTVSYDGNFYDSSK